MVNGNGLTRWYVLETPIMLMRFTMPRLFNIAHFQNQRKTSRVVYGCAANSGRLDRRAFRVED
jgi:hypothetical protein